jgi:hypothetical protein
MSSNARAMCAAYPGAVRAEPAELAIAADPGQRALGPHAVLAHRVRQVDPGRRRRNRRCGGDRIEAPRRTGSERGRRRPTTAT